MDGANELRDVVDVGEDVIGRHDGGRPILRPDLTGELRREKELAQGVILPQ